MTDRRKVLQGLLATASASTLMTVTPAFGQSIRPVKESSKNFNNLPPVIRDQGMGATDASGYVANFPLRATGAKQVWINTTTGSPSFNGLSPYPGYQLNGSGPNYQVGATGPGAANAIFGPKAAYADAVNSIYPTFSGGEGHQFFFAEGQTFIIDKTQYGIMFYHGKGATYPACFQSYDPRDPLNVAKHGRAGTGSQGARPVWTLGTGAFPGNWRGDAYDYGGFVFRGMEWRSTGNGQPAAWLYCQNNILFEGMVFNNVSLGLANYNPNPGFNISSNNIVRYCSSYGQYDAGGAHMCGFYSENTQLTLEDCVFWHNGWKVGVSRDAPVSAGGPDIFKHCVYIHGGPSTSALIRRNVLIDGSSSALSLRGSHLCHHNVIIDCPTPESKSGGSGSDTESPNGVSQHSYCQLVLGGADINSSLPRMQGFSCSDGTPDSYYAYCLYANNPGYGKVNNQWLLVADNVAAQITNVGFYYNQAYAFAPPARRLALTKSAGGSLSSIKITADTSNVLSPTSPMTNAQIYAAIGYASKQAMVNAMIADPVVPWAYGLLAAASTGFQFNFNRVMS